MVSKLAFAHSLASLLALAAASCASNSAHGTRGGESASLSGILERVAKADPAALHRASQDLGSSGMSAPHQQGAARALPDAGVSGAGGNGSDDVIWFDLAPEPCFSEIQARRALAGDWRLLAPGAYEYSNSAYQANVYLNPQTQCVSKFRIWHRTRP